MTTEDGYSPTELYELGLHYATIQHGNRTDNLERSIELFTRVAADKAAAPFTVALACYELGISYQERALGRKQDNLRAALSAYQTASEAIGTPADDQQRALLGDTLGNTASIHLQLDDPEAAIRACESAREVQSPERTRRSWGVTHCTLGGAYLAREQGTRRANLEAASTAFETALQVRTPDGEPELHRRTRHMIHYVRQLLQAEEEPADEHLTELIGQAELHLSSGLATGSAAEFERAEALYAEALASTDPPIQGALKGSALNNLGVCYLQRSGTKDDVDRAIALFRQALGVPERIADPHRWAITQYSLSAALIRWPPVSRENADLAVQAAEAALDILTQAAAEQHWVSARTNLGLALVARYISALAADSQGDHADLLRAVDALETALSLEDRLGEISPSAQSALASAYLFLVSRAESGRRRHDYARLVAEHAPELLAAHPEHSELRRQIDVILVCSYAELSRHDPSGDTEEFIWRYEAFLAAPGAGLGDLADLVDLADVRASLAAAYLRRLAGDRAENAARAVALCTSLLDPAAAADGRVKAHADLGDAYRATGERESAAANYRAALRAAAELSPDALSPAVAAVDTRTVGAAAALLALEAPARR
jgi:tetratricopeptide (TPR) repeat protein